MMHFIPAIVVACCLAFALAQGSLWGSALLGVALGGTAVLGELAREEASR